MRWTTKFPTTVKVGSLPVVKTTGLRVIKSGASNRKVGGSMKVGRWKGMPIYALTLVERETCPTDCVHWTDCYGNNMHRAVRHGVTDELVPAIRYDVKVLAARHPDGFIVRLHILGDFYSTDYVMEWWRLLEEYPALHIYGYTARQYDDPIGVGVAVLQKRWRDRVSIMRSGRRVDMDPLPGAYSEDDPRLPTIRGNSQRKIPDCPEQVGRAASCGDCGLCMTGRHEVVFITH